MDKAARVHRRKKRYMAIILGVFEEHIEPHVTKEQADLFKGIVREKLNAMAIDTIEIMNTPRGVEINEAAEELRDQVGAPSTRRTAA
jgi:uncharacterized secreted protein with C-terminal beta-propeller domain